MPTATVEEVQARLPELLRQLGEGEEVTIVSGGRTVARLLPVPVHAADALPGDLDGDIPPELDPRMVELADRMDTLTPAERAELLAWVVLAEDPAAARVAPPRLADVFPELTDRL